MGRVVKSLILAGVLALAPLSLDAGEKPLTVVELFTSQGCSSCPPADAFLGELADRDGVLALSFHVDYWDYIGWKDPFASARHTRRQRDYARAFRLRYVYTPQMVIQGTVQATGSDRAAVEAAIDRGRQVGRIPVTLGRDAGGKVIASIPQAETEEELAVWAVVYDRRHVTAVKRGENRGRTITNRNVVRGLRRIATWRGAALQVPVAVSDMAAAGDACAVVLQSTRTGRIFGAARLALDGGRS